MKKNGFNPREDLQIRRISFDNENTEEDDIIEEEVVDSLDIKVIELLREGFEDFKLLLMRFMKFFENFEERLQKLEQRQEKLEVEIKGSLK